MGRMRMDVGALSLQVRRAWTESPGHGLRPLASVLRAEPGAARRHCMRELEVGQALVIDWPEEEIAEPGVAWLTCPVCGVSASEEAFDRVGPGCSLCPRCGKVLPL